MNNDELNEALTFALLGAAGRVERRLDGALSNIRGISFSEYQILKALRDSHNATATRVDLAGVVGLSASGVTRALKPLEKLGYVETKRSDRDARLSLATLTKHGQDLVADADVVVNDAIATMGPFNGLDRALRTALRNGLENLGVK